MISKIYLSGPMRGLPDFNIPAFDYAAAKLRAQGFSVFSPADRDREAGLHQVASSPDHIGSPIIGNFDVREALAADMDYICKVADAVAVLPGWENSLGARAEVATAKALGKTIIFLGREYWNVAMS